MSTLFPSELIATISSGRAPFPEVVDVVAKHVLRDWMGAGYCVGPAREYAARLARAVAQAALAGGPSGQAGKGDTSPRPSA